MSPDLDEGHIALGQVYESAFEFTRASEEYERALALGPGNARVLRGYGTFASLMGHENSALTALHRSLALDPLNPSSQWALGWGLTKLRRYREAIAAFQEFRTFKPDDPGASGFIGLNYYLLGDFQRARLFCENKSDEEISQMCLAMTYEKLGRHADAEAALAKMHNSTTGGSRPLFLASIYAQWGNIDRALESLDSAMRMHDPGLELLKTDPLMDPLRKEPRFQAVMRELKFPS